MAREFFRRAIAGRRSPSGNIIGNIQTALQLAGNSGLSVDGVYGGQTETALRAYQTQLHLGVTGTVTAETWTGLMNCPEPAIFTRCLQVTASFEGTGFDQVVGNFDGAGITWGIIGFTLGNGELGAVLAEIEKQSPELIAKIFGSDAAQIVHVTGAGCSAAERTNWANSISLGTNKYDVAQPWKDCFHRLGNEAVVQKIEIDRARQKYWTLAKRDSEALGMKEELDYLLLFDVAVQNGGLAGKDRLSSVKEAFASKKPATALDRRRIVATVVADTSAKKYRQDVLSRKLSIAEGSGKIHGALYDFGDWGLIDGASPLSPDS